MPGESSTISLLIEREFIAGRIRSRFRDNIFEQGAKRLDYLLAQGRKSLRRLRRANLGDVKAIQTVLNQTYGRVGKRKHELLKVHLSNFFCVLTL